MTHDDVSQHFDAEAADFDSIYDNSGGISSKVINTIFRQSVYERAQLAVRTTRPHKDKRILDVGCGSGRVAVELARQGAIATGIDDAEEMIRLSQEREASAETENISFEKADFRQWNPEAMFDVSIALGVFDYLPEPQSFLDKMTDITTEQVIATFPAKYSVQAPIRYVWRGAKGVKVYYYTKSDVANLFSENGFEQVRVASLPAESSIADIYFVDAKLSGR